VNLMTRVDLNCDLGEGAGHGAELMPFISSANVACGGHAGDESTMRAIVALATEHGVAVGAHPGFADRENFGRIERPVTPGEAASVVSAQVAVFSEIAGDRLRHVKLHGALYNQVARDAQLAAAVADELCRRWPTLLLLAPARSELLRAARARRMQVASEVFADRTYQRDGSLTPRSRPEALIHDEDQAVTQVLRVVLEGTVQATDGSSVQIEADTICLHGDGPHAVAFARRINAELRNTGVAIKPFDHGFRG
jgi:5-oxoprolinase (ATP-hydrolysing) subunit A